jgi:hypothetical protein
MDFAFVPLKPDDQIYLDNAMRRRLVEMASELRKLVEDDTVEMAQLWKPVIELGQEALFAAAAEAGDLENGPVWQMGAMALTEPARLGKEMETAPTIVEHWQGLGDKVEAMQDRWLGHAPGEREMVHLIFQMAEKAEVASWGMSPAEMAQVGAMGMYVAGYLGLELGRPEAGIAFAALAAMDELELLDALAGHAAVAALHQRGLDVALGAAMPFLIEDQPGDLR